MSTQGNQVQLSHESYSFTGSKIARYDEYDEYYVYPNIIRRECWLSIVLDREARYDFSAVRLLILYEPTQFFDNLVVMPRRLSSQQERYSHAARRSVGTDRRKLAQLSPAEVCTVTFKLSPQDGTFDIADTSVRPCYLGSQRILYDRTYPTSPYNPSVFASLCFSIPSINLNSPFYDTYESPSTHRVRILPMSSRRKGSSIALPFAVIQQIVCLAIEDVYLWREQLLSYALVCKAWEHVLGLFLERFSDDPMKQGAERSNIHHLLHLLQWRPQYGALISRLSSSSSYRGFHVGSWPPPEDFSTWHTFLGIMRYATSLSYLELPDLPSEMLDKMIPALCNLREIREVVFGPDSPYSFYGDCNPMSMASILTIITNWNKLEKLSIKGWQEAQEHDSESVPNSELGCTIKWLELRHGSIAADQLLYLCSSASCNLSKINFHVLAGPSNADFRRFLSVTAPTLQEATVTACNFPLSDGEELALDAIMPEIAALQTLSVTDDVISVLSLVRKPCAPLLALNSSSPRYSTIVISALEQSNMYLEDLIRAICVTQWGAIELHDMPWYRDDPMIHSVEEIARYRGIKIVMNMAPSSDSEPESSSDYSYTLAEDADFHREHNPQSLS